MGVVRLPATLWLFGFLPFLLTNVALNLTRSVGVLPSKTQNNGRIISSDLPPFSSSTSSSLPSPELLRLFQLKTYRQPHWLFHEQSVDRPICSMGYDEWKTTLVLQMSADRGPWIAQMHCQRWHDPIVMVVYYGNQTLWDKYEAIWMEQVVKSDNCKNNKNISFVWVLNDILPDNSESNNTTTNGPDTMAPSLTHVQDTYYYPINMLRNLGLERVRTSHALVLDADFIPSMGLANDIADALRTRAVQSTHKDIDHRQALVVPVFEHNVNHNITINNNNGIKQSLSLKNDTSELVYDSPWQSSRSIPSTFEDLSVCYQNNVCAPFHEISASVGHSSTRTQDWLQKKWYQKSAVDSRNNKTRTATLDIKRIPCLFSQKYEPYVVLPWCTPTLERNSRPAPMFDERFENYGFNKIQYFHQLRMMQYEFYVVPKGFAFHLPHGESVLSIRFRAIDRIEYQQRKALWVSFQKQLQHRYKKRYAKIKLCPKENESPRKYVAR